MHRIPDSSLLISEIRFAASRSSGPGGQNVNKVNSRITLSFDIPNSSLLTEEEKALLLQKLSTKITNDGVLMISSQEKRSQVDNKNATLSRFDLLLKNAFTPKKARKKTKASASSKEQRIKKKKQHSEKKKWRQRPV